MANTATGSFMTNPETPVWFITGCSTGLGRALAQLVIDRGCRAVVTARDAERVADLAAGGDDRVLALSLDMADTNAIDEAVTQATDKFGRIDVLVNNAGYGYQSSVEEGEDAEIRAQFEANVFGLFRITQKILPTMRAQHAGHILNISSVAGFIGFPGSGYYAASKHAVEGWSDALAAEVAPLGIHVTCVEPGPFRTDWAGRSLKQTTTRIDDYSDSAGARMAGTSQGSGKQPGDPVKAGEAMIEIVASDAPPLHIVLGAWGVDKVKDYLNETLKEIEDWHAVSVATDYATD